MTVMASVVRMMVLALVVVKRTVKVMTNLMFVAVSAVGMPLEVTLSVGEFALAHVSPSPIVRVDGKERKR